MISKALEILQILGERVKQRVIRGGVVKKKLICPMGYKADGVRCVKMQSKEVVRRKRAAKKMVRKKKGKSNAQSNMKRQRSLRKHTW